MPKFKRLFFRTISSVLNIIASVVFAVVLFVIIFSGRMFRDKETMKDEFYVKLKTVDSVVVRVTENFGSTRSFSFSIGSNEFLNCLPDAHLFSESIYTKVVPIYICDVEFLDKETHALSFYGDRTICIDGSFVSVEEDVLLRKILNNPPYDKKIHPSWYGPIHGGD